jgi:serine/threonine-protein kinase
MQTADLKDRLQTILAGGYHVERELDGGGMARVFLATDRVLRRKIVIKVLEFEFGEDLSAERFEQEIRLAAGLQQANIVPLLIANRAEGLTYYTMPYVDGRSLRERIDIGPIPVAEAIGVLRDVARALAFAHAHGVVHRDIKPGNVLISGGTAVVTDFGIAKALRIALAEGAPTTLSRLTGEGQQVGTPAYMAPEQIDGDERVDHRADIYCWGLLGYQLLANRHPFAHRRGASQLLSAQLREMPTPLDEANPDCPGHIASLVMRCLAKSPDARPESAQELIDTLDPPTLGYATSVVAAAQAASTVPSVAVLPFVNVGGDTADEFLADGITEEILSALAHEHGIRVAARTSCFAFKGRKHDLREIAARLGVRTVLEGSVRRVGARVRVMTQLVSAEDGLQLWNATFDRELEDLLQVQAEIARAIVDTLRSALHDVATSGGATGGGGATTPRATRRSRPVGKTNVEAYESYLRGRLHLDQRSIDVTSAIACFERAVQIDPYLSVAHAGLAHTYTWLGLWYVIPAPAAFAKVSEAAGRALSIDPNDAVALSASAITALWHDWDWDKAEHLAWRAVDIAPGLPLGHSVMTYVRIAGGDPAGAIASAERAVVLDPLSSAAKTDLADALRFARRHEEARTILEPLLKREPANLLANLWMAYQLEILGDVAAAVGYVEQATAAAARGPALLAAYARQLAVAGREDDARTVVSELETRRQHEYVASFVMAVATVALGDVDATIGHLQRAVAARDPHVIHLHLEHFWVPLHGDPRFQQLLRSVGLTNKR